MSEQTLHSYLELAIPMPLERQACLATLVVEKVPGRAGEGYRLRAQLTASLAYDSHTTEIHSSRDRI
jgi:hypothetical protein